MPIIPDYLRYIGAWDTHVEGETYNMTKNGTRIQTGMGHIVFEGEDSAVGVLFASKAIVQLLINPFSGAIIDKIGYDIPMMIGLTIMFLSTAMFACGQSYGVLFFARSLQGVGSAFADTGGLAMIADRFTEESERSKAIGIAQAFISFGSLVAPPFGGLLYQFAGKEVPFIVLSLVSLFDGFALLFVMRPVKQALKDAGVERPKGTPIWKLFIDPYIAVCAGTLVMANISLAFLEPTISLWMENTMDVEEWQMGLIWLPAFFPHVIGVYTTVKLCKSYPQYQWLLAAIGLGMEGFCSFFVPFARSFWFLILPLSGICFGIAQVDTSLLPMLGYLVDVRYVSVYGSIYAIADISYSLAYAIGPIIAGGIVQSIGFLALNILIAVTNLLYVPVIAMLRNVYDYKPFENEANILMEDPPPKQYQTYVLQDGAATIPENQPPQVQQTEFINQQQQQPPPQQQQQELQPQQQQNQQYPPTNPFQQELSQQSKQGGEPQPPRNPKPRKQIRGRGYRSSDMERIITSSDEDLE